MPSSSTMIANGHTDSAIRVAGAEMTEEACPGAQNEPSLSKSVSQTSVDCSKYSSLNDRCETLSATLNELKQGPDSLFPFWIPCKAISYLWSPKQFTIPEPSCSYDAESENACVMGGLGGSEKVSGQLDRSGYGEAWLVRISEGCQDLHHPSDSPNKEIPVIAVKDLGSSHTNDFENEREMLAALRTNRHEHLVTLLAAYKYKENGHLRVPYATENLRSLWEPCSKLQRNLSMYSSEILDILGGTSTGGLIAIMLSRLSGLKDGHDTNDSSSSGPYTGKHDRPDWSQHFQDLGVPGANLNNCNSAPLEASSQWILSCREFKGWRDQLDGCFWVSGSPGTGKSTLMSTISRYLKIHRRSGESIVAYSVDADNKVVNHSVLILGQILAELLLRERSKVSREDMESIFMDLVLSEGSLTASQMTYILSRIRHNLTSHETLNVLIDGLDELERDNEEQHRLFELVDHLTRYDPDHHIKCLISSRMTLGRIFRHEFEVHLDSHASNREILELYVREGVNKWNINQNTPSGEKLANTIANKADGVFLWAHLVLEHIQRSSSSHSSPEYFSDWSALIDTGNLPALYRAMLEKIEECNRTAALSMLRWATYASRPLYTQELLGALHAETGIELQENNIIEACAGLLSINEAGIVRLVHSSLREYLRTRMRGNWNDISDEANQIIAQACLKGLDPESLLVSLGLFRRGSDPQELRVQPHAFEDYARQFWMFHYRLAESGSSFLPGLLHNALELSLRKVQSFQQHDLQPTEDNLRPLLLDAVNVGLLVGCRFGLPKLVKLELEMGANANLVAGKDRISSFIWAVVFGHVDAVELLIQYGANSQLASKSGNTPLVYAIANGRIDIVKLLMESDLQSLGEPTESFSLVVSSTEPCDICGAVAAKYELTPCTAVINTNETATYPPIIIHSEFVARTEMRLSIFRYPADTMSTRPSIPIKWFAGTQMYGALQIATNYGIENFKALLVAVGNDIETLNHPFSVTRLVSEMRLL